MNSKRKIKRMFSAMDDIALPSAEKMLPPRRWLKGAIPFAAKESRFLNLRLWALPQ